MIGSLAGGVVAIGMSAGGIQALRVIAPRLPEDLDAAVIVAQHAGATRTLAALLSVWAGRDIQLVRGGERLMRGAIYVCPAGHHISVEPDFRIAITSFERILMVRPSLDWLFGSLAATFAERAVGVVLSGANGDGARGLRQIVEAGGRAIVQAPATCTFAMMSEAALELCPHAVTATPEELATAILDSVDGQLAAGTASPGARSAPAQQMYEDLSVH